MYLSDMPYVANFDNINNSEENVNWMVGSHSLNHPVQLAPGS